MCKKLTAERAQERIAHLKQWQQQRGLTLREEEYLEALEGYLILLTAEKRREGCDGGHWTEVTEQEYQDNKHCYFYRTVFILDKEL